MPWKIEDVEKFNDGLSEKQKTVWVRVANAVIAECNDVGDKDCEALAIKHANTSAKRLDASSFLNFKVGEVEDYDFLSLKTIDGDKGIEALVSGDDMVEYFFSKSAPYNWTQENLKDWAGKKFGLIQFAAGMGIEYLPDDELPPNVVEYREKLRSSRGGEPFIRRMTLKTGKFVIGGDKKVYFSKEFYDKWGPSFARKPIYKGHQGIGSTDDRPRIGIILAYQNVEGEPFSWIYLNDRSVIETIKEYEALGISNEEDSPYGQFSLEMFATKVKTDKEGYMEPVELYRKGLALALVGEAGATGTKIEKIAAMQQIEEGSKMSDKKVEELLFKNASMDEIKGHPKFSEAFAAFAESLVEKPLDGENPLSEVLSAVSVKNTEGFNELIKDACDSAVEMMSALELRGKILEGVTVEEVPWLAGFSGAIAELDAEKIKGLPKFPEAVASMGKDTLMELPAVKEAMEVKGKEGTANVMAAQMVGEIFKQAGVSLGSAQGLLIGNSDGMTEEEKEKAGKKNQIQAIVAKANDKGMGTLKEDEFATIEPFLDDLCAKNLIKL